MGLTLSLNYSNSIARLKVIFSKNVPFVTHGVRHKWNIFSYFLSRRSPNHVTYDKTLT